MSPNYKLRNGSLKKFLLAISIATVAVVCVADAAPIAKKYPPYPEVWHRMVPEPRAERLSPTFFRTGEGEYKIVYSRRVIQLNDGARLEHSAIDFFSGAVEKSREMSSLMGKVPLIQGAVDFAFSSGQKITLKNFDRREPKRCPQSLNHYYLIEHPDGRTAQKKSLLYILDKPRRMEVNERCVDASGEIFDERVNALGGLFVPLDDGGFLLTDDSGFVLRFDANLQTKSDLLNRKLFWVDTALIEQYRAEHIETPNMYQHMHDKILNYLNSIDQ